MQQHFCHGSSTSFGSCVIPLSIFVSSNNCMCCKCCSQRNNGCPQNGPQSPFHEVFARTIKYCSAEWGIPLRMYFLNWATFCAPPGNLWLTSKLCFKLWGRVGLISILVLGDSEDDLCRMGFGALMQWQSVARWRGWAQPPGYENTRVRLRAQLVPNNCIITMQCPKSCPRLEMQTVADCINPPTLYTTYNCNPETCLRKTPKTSIYMCCMTNAIYTESDTFVSLPQVTLMASQSKVEDNYIYSNIYIYVRFLWLPTIHPQPHPASCRKVWVQRQAGGTTPTTE